jgi:hypothetical protein
MINLKSFTEEQQANFYKRFCEVAIRVFACSQDETSVSEWVKLYSTILEITDVKVRKNKKGFDISKDIYSEVVALDMANSDILDSISRQLNLFDNGTTEGSRPIRNVWTYIKVANNKRKKC